ncbi:COBRA-like protein 6 [Senna tora]|uniref:COBRA-like protein 6 n=1 Tax=Senna tora TaxID=362788 RepID=A0A834XCM2_9FABA|nr:COBRA-like protein 6 [Senna tora]
MSASDWGYDLLYTDLPLSFCTVFGVQSVISTSANFEQVKRVKVSIHNFQLYRHVENPGWKLSWVWKGDEVIWKMWGAEAIEQGNCSRFKAQERPHCCEKEPTIIDLTPGTPYQLQVTNCCKGGVLTSMTQDPTKSSAIFQMNFNKASNFSIPTDDSSSENVTTNNNSMPEKFSLGIPGYSCSDPFQVPPSKVTTDGRRWTQVLDTWNVTCIYSQFLASPAPKCCVSLSAFYNSTIIPCPKCSCNCQGLAGANCVNSGESPSLLQLPHDMSTEDPAPLVRCSQHMCPIRVHWHVKQSYKEYWRVKITITNLNLVKNYSQWNLVLLHPNLQSITQVFSFNYQPLSVYGDTNDTGMFWGIKYYNDMLLQSGVSGNVQTEMLLHKDAGNFTFREGWAFPRKVSFNGDECVMPSPDDYPRLPNAAHIAAKASFSLANKHDFAKLQTEAKICGSQFSHYYHQSRIPDWWKFRNSQIDKAFDYIIVTRTSVGGETVTAVELPPPASQLTEIGRFRQ